MKNLYNAALALVIVGALNWGLVGVFGFNLVEAMLGAGTFLSSAVYALVGASAVVVAVMVMSPSVMNAQNE